MNKKLKFNKDEIELLLTNGFIDNYFHFHQEAYLAYVDDEYCVSDLKTDEVFLQDDIFIVRNEKFTMEDYYATTLNVKTKCFAIKRQSNELGVCKNLYDLIKCRKRMFIVEDKYAYELDKKVVECVNSMIKQYEKYGI
jgi:hypothetical protein